MHLAVQRMLI